MHGVYERLQREGIIGPMEMRDGSLQMRPLQEYPKWVTKASGERIVVKDLASEIAAVGDATPAKDAKPDPLAAERTKLLEATEAAVKSQKALDEQIAQIKAQMAELQSIRQGATPAPATPPAKPTSPKAAA